MELESLRIGQIVWCNKFIRSSGGRPTLHGKGKTYLSYKTKQAKRFKIIGLRSHKRRELPQIVVVLKSHLTSWIKCARFLDLIWNEYEINKP